MFAKVTAETNQQIPRKDLFLIVFLINEINIKSWRIKCGIYL